MYQALTQKKKQLARYRPLKTALVRNLDDWFRVELTYTSNAIEGNTLTRQETALVVGTGITVGGKSLVEHLEATNHAAALDWVRALVARKPAKITEDDILRIHALILKGIDDASAGRYRRVSVRIAGSTVVLPNFLKVPDLLQRCVRAVHANKKMHAVERAALAHYELVTIHPFVDGNGRTARLLMNLLLLQAGYPPAIIRTRDRLAYIQALETAQLGGSKAVFFQLIARAVDRSLDIYLHAVRGKTAAPPAEETRLLRIGALARLAHETVSTIRHWTTAGLLEIAEVTPAGYQLYAREMLQRVQQIKTFQSQRFTLKEIREQLGAIARVR